jgi:glycerophosphoryl diester phosphodiesterase
MQRARRERAMGKGAVISPGFTPAAHRGASRQFPENTIQAFGRALELLPGCLIETDVRQTRDGEIMAIHDEFLGRNTDGDGPVWGKTASEIQALDAGYGVTFDGGRSFPFRGAGHRIPLLIEVLDAFPAAKFSIDIKDRDLDAAERVLAILQEKKALHRVIVGSFHDRVIRFVRKKSAEVITSFSKYDFIRFKTSHKLMLHGLFGRCGDAMLVPEMLGGGSPEYTEKRTARRIRIITPRLIEEAHRMGIPVLAWTIDRPENMRRLIDWGIDGIVTNFIDILKEVMIEKGILL